jgi:hypothetical protein
MPDINELFRSGNLKRLVLSDNLQLVKTAENYLNGLQHIVGDNGLTQLEVQPDLYFKWVDFDNTDVQLGTSMTNYLLSVIPNKAITPDNGIIQAAFKVTKTTPVGGEIYVDLFINDTLYKTKIISLPKVIGDKYPVIINSLFDTAIPMNIPIHIKVRCVATSNIKLVGTDFPSVLRIIKTKDILSADNIADDMISFRAASIATQIINKYNNTLQFDVFDYANKVQYNQTEDYFKFEDKGNVAFDIQLNNDFTGGQERYWIWLEKLVDTNWLAQTAEQYYIEFNHSTEGLRNVRFTAKVMANDKFRIRHASDHPSIQTRLKMQQKTTYDGTHLTVGSAKVTITQTL